MTHPFPFSCKYNADVLPFSHAFKVSKSHACATCLLCIDQSARDLLDVPTNQWKVKISAFRLKFSFPYAKHGPINKKKNHLKFWLRYKKKTKWKWSRLAELGSSPPPTPWLLPPLHSFSSSTLWLLLPPLHACLRSQKMKKNSSVGNFFDVLITFKVKKKTRKVLIN